MALFRRTLEEVLKKSCQERENEFLDIDSNFQIYGGILSLGTDSLHEWSNELGMESV